MYGYTQRFRGSTHRTGGILDFVLSDIPDVWKVMVEFSIIRSDHSHVCTVLDDLLLCAHGFNTSYEVVLKFRVIWRAVRLDVAQMPWDVIGRRSVMMDILNVELNRIV